MSHQQEMTSISRNQSGREKREIARQNTLQGSTHDRSNYKVLACGNSAEDLAKIAGCFVVLYSFLVFVFWLLLKSVKLTQTSNVALFVFLGLFVAFVGFLAVLVMQGNKDYERKQEEERRANAGEATRV